MLTLLCLIVACALVPLGARAAATQPAEAPDTLRAEVVPGLYFEDARALAADPAGVLYVADAGAGVVVRLAPGGLPERLGGPGGSEGAFDEPADVDPTNGLVLLVADAGNSRIQRFTREMRHLETLPVGRGYGAAGERPARPVYNAGQEDAHELGRGRPIAVATAATGEVLAVDAAEGVVVRWDAGQRVRETIGGFGAGEGALAEPVALAVSARGEAFVADRGRAAVVVYDALGTHLRTLPLGDDGAAVVALAIRKNEWWAVLPDRLLVFSMEGERLRAIPVALLAPLVDIAFVGERLFLLTEERLYQEIPPAAHSNQ